MQWGLVHCQIIKNTTIILEIAIDDRALHLQNLWAKIYLKLCVNTTNKQKMAFSSFTFSKVNTLN